MKLGHTTVLFGERNGKYPQGNSLLVEGADETVLIDPSIAVAEGRFELPRVDRVVNSHCHEDHIAGNGRFDEVPWHLHEEDALGIRSLEGLMTIYGYDGPIDAAWREAVVKKFHFKPRPDPTTFKDGDVLDFGGGVRLRVVHAPGHTRGHSFFFIEPDGILYLGDVDLSSFGPYYGDAWSSLEDFERTLALARTLEARWYATFHHIGILDGRTAFLERLDKFAAVIADRERRLLEYLREPHKLDEIAAHRFIYRPQDPVSFADAVERRSMAQHLERMLGSGEVREVEPGRWVAVS